MILMFVSDLLHSWVLVYQPFTTQAYNLQAIRLSDKPSPTRVTKHLTMFTRGDM